MYNPTDHADESTPHRSESSDERKAPRLHECFHLETERERCHARCGLSRTIQTLWVCSLLEKGLDELCTPEEARHVEGIVPLPVLLINVSIAE